MNRYACREVSSINKTGKRRQCPFFSAKILEWRAGFGYENFNTIPNQSNLIVELGTFDLYLKGTILIIKHAPQIYRATRDVVTDPIIRKTTGKLVNTLVTGAKTIYDDVNIYYYSIVRDKAEDAYNTASSAIKQGTNTVLNTVTDLYNNPAMRDTANTAYRTVSAMSESVSNAYSGVKEKTETAIKSVTESVKNGTAGIDTNTTINQATHYVSHYLLGSSPIRAKL